MLGGTFNPPHRAHLQLARHALAELALERVVLMPARLSPFKDAARDAAADPGAERRLEMCRLLVEGARGVAVSALECDRDGPSYTVDTLRALHAAHPATTFTLILGADVARTLPAWREPRELLGLAELAVALRPGSAPEQVQGALAALSERRAAAHRVRFLTMPPLEISSSLVRARVARGEPIAQLVGARVARYIAAHLLYRAPLRAAGAR